MKVIRVFPRKTRATPDDENVRINCLPGLFDQADEIHISVTFTPDIGRAESLARYWEILGVPVKVGGVAYNTPSGEFVPGMYIKHGYVITSRGCPNHCWFCSVWKRETTGIKELEIKNGFNVLDDNLLACSDDHINAVFDMLLRQTERPSFTGGLEAKILKQWHVDRLKEVRPRQMFFAYDTPDDKEPLIEASRMLQKAGFNRQTMRCFVLIGYPGDTVKDAGERLMMAINFGYYPQAMLWMDNKGKRNKDFMQIYRSFSRPALIYSLTKELQTSWKS